MEKLQTLKEVKFKLMKLIKYKNDVQISVKVYDCDEDDEQTYDVEIICSEGDKLNYLDFFVTDRAYEGELKLAEKRAKSVLKTVKGWFEYNNNVFVEDNIEVYHV